MPKETTPSGGQPHPEATAEFLAEHYVYEINMLRATHVLILHSDSWLLSNALMKSFAIHARVLLDFFGKPKGGDDAVAAHFTKAEAVTNSATAAVPISVRQRLNKQIPHLTYSRANAIKIHDGDREMLRKAIEADHAAFKGALRPEFAGCFTKEVAQFSLPVAPFRRPRPEIGR